MAAKILLFVYGTLQPGQSPPKSASQSWPDRVRGQMFDLGAYPAATDLDNGSNWIDGHTIELDADELPALDEYEDIASGEFRRMVVTTGRGFTAYAYEYTRPLPDGAKAVTKWPPAGP